MDAEYRNYADRLVKQHGAAEAETLLLDMARSIAQRGIKERSMRPRETTGEERCLALKALVASFVSNGTAPQVASDEMLGTAIGLALACASPEQVARSLERMADEIRREAERREAQRATAH